VTGVPTQLVRDDGHDAGNTESTHATMGATFDPGDIDHRRASDVVGVVRFDPDLHGHSHWSPPSRPLRTNDRRSGGSRFIGRGGFGRDEDEHESDDPDELIP
jgi:hypothetical protein